MAKKMTAADWWNRAKQWEAAERERRSRADYAWSMNDRRRMAGLRASESRARNKAFACRLEAYKLDPKIERKMT